MPKWSTLRHVLLTIACFQTAYHPDRRESLAAWLSAFHADPAATTQAMLRRCPKCRDVAGRLAAGFEPTLQFVDDRFGTRTGPAVGRWLIMITPGQWTDITLCYTAPTEPDDER